MSDAQDRGRPRPLDGLRVLVTRPREQAGEIVERLTELGAGVIDAPTIRIAPPEDPGPLRQAAADPGAFDWIVFASANAIDAFMAARAGLDGAPRALEGPAIGVVGTSTAAHLARHGLTADLVPEEFRAEALADAIVGRGPIAGRRVLLPRADIGREVIADRLRRAGAIVTEVVAYRTVTADRRADDPVPRLLAEGRIDVVTFTSASAVRGFAEIYTAERIAGTTVAVIGPTAAGAAAALDIEVHIQPAIYTVAALVEAIVEWADGRTRTARGTQPRRT